MTTKEYILGRENLLAKLKEKKMTYAECHKQLQELYAEYVKFNRGKKKVSML